MYFLLFQMFLTIFHKRNLEIYHVIHNFIDIKKMHILKPRAYVYHVMLQFWGHCCYMNPPI